jgi:ribosomal protein L16 Arg81 hydroxylase
MNSHLEHLVSPISKTQFLAERWGRRPLLADGVDRRLRSVVELSELDRLLVTAADEPGGTRGAYCVRSDDETTVEYPIAAEASDRRSPAAAREALSEGYTLVINRLHHTHPTVSQMCANLEAELDHPVGCNLYYTPPLSQGFRPHRDFQDTFFLQLEGHKTWHLWEPATKIPVREENASQPEAPDRPPDSVIELEADDVLYLPRGWIHAGHTSARESLHITLAVRPTTWSELLTTWLTMQTRSARRLREALPLEGAVRGADQSLVSMASELLKEMVADPGLGTQLDEAFDSLLSTRLERPRAELGTDFSRKLNALDLHLDDFVERCAGLRPRVFDSRDGVRLAFLGGFVNAPVDARTAFEFIAASPQFQVAALPDLPDDAKLALVSGLIRNGFLRQAAP